MLNVSGTSTGIPSDGRTVRHCDEHNNLTYVEKIGWQKTTNHVESSSFVVYIMIVVIDHPRNAAMFSRHYADDGGSRIINKTTTLVLDLYEHQSQSQLCFSGRSVWLVNFFATIFRVIKVRCFEFIFRFLTSVFETTAHRVDLLACSQHEIQPPPSHHLSIVRFGKIPVWIPRCDDMVGNEMNILCLVARSWIDSAMEDVCEILDRTAGEKRRDLYVNIL